MSNQQTDIFIEHVQELLDEKRGEIIKQIRASQKMTQGDYNEGYNDGIEDALDIVKELL